MRIRLGVFGVLISFLFAGCSSDSEKASEGGSAGAATGGAAGQGGSAGKATGGTAGQAAGGSAGKATGGTAGSTTACEPNQKRCGDTCVPLDAPQTGCANLLSCEPCEFPRATSICENGTCKQGDCFEGYADCTSEPGCETHIASDINHCGECFRACSSDQVKDLICEKGLCTSTCTSEWANCNLPETGPDDGCEVNLIINSNNCGSCGHVCTDGWVCILGKCWCNDDQDCRIETPSHGTCAANMGLCTCGTTQCRRGEYCRFASSQYQCSCNGGEACPANHICCQNPSGCFNIYEDKDNCGGCGFKCGPGQVCKKEKCIDE